MGGKEQENPFAEGEVRTGKNGASCYSLLRFIAYLGFYVSILDIRYSVFLQKRIHRLDF